MMRRIRSMVDSIQPLRRKLPLLISALLCAVVLSFGWLAHRELADAFDAAAGDRLTGAAQRLASLLAQSTTTGRSDLRRVASDSAIVRALAEPGTAARDLAVARLERQLSRSAAAASRALFDRQCRERLSVGAVEPIGGGDGCPLAHPIAAEAADSGSTDAWVLPFEARGDTIVYGVVAPVIRGASDTLGYLVHTRSLAGGGSNKEISSLIGEGAAFLIGNAGGEPLWTDQEHVVAGPPRPLAMGRPIHYVPANGPPQIGVALEVPKTPWLVWVQIPAAAAVAAEARTLRSLAIIALGCILLGALGAWMLGNHVTSPLAEVITAAEDFARGDYSRRVTMQRRDEMGNLAASFNHMAAQVESATEELRVQAETLEEQVLQAQELTHELEITNQELTEAAREAKAARVDTALAQSLLSQLITRAPVGVAVFDRNLRFVRVNESLAQIHGVPLEAHIGRHVRDVVPALEAATEPLLRRVLETGETISASPISGTFSDHMAGHWLASCFPIPGADGDSIGVGAIFVDTTAQRELEAQFLQAQKMEAVGRLAGGVAHDFNNLLTVISSYADLLVDELEPQDTRRQDLGEIRRAADRATGLTRQLLAFSRKQVLQPATLSLDTVVAGTEKMLGRLIGEHIELRTVQGHDLGTVHADPGQIEQVIMNLVVNARDAMPDGGRITIETANVQLSEDDVGRRIAVPAGSYVMLAVSDTGHGMGPDVLEHLFEPFFTTKPQGQGTGLGLSTVFGIVRQSGGDVWVYSEAGAGTTFKVYLPRTGQELPLASSGAGQSLPQRGAETILLAEDDDALRTLASRVLTKQGYTVIEARNGLDALDLCTNYEGSIDLILSDIVMPELGGRALVERLSVSRPRTRVLFMSGYTDDDVFRRALIDNHSEFLQKPFTPASLAKRVRQVLDSVDRNAA